MFSLAGIPPLAGFWGKLYIFIAAVEAKLYCPAVLGVLASVVASYYYLRIVKVMYFDEPAEALDQPAVRRQPRRGLRGGHPGGGVLARAAAAQPGGRRGGEGPVPVSPAPVLPDGWTLVALRQRRQHQRRGRAPGRRRRARRHRRVVARADRRARPPRPPLGLAGRQSLHLDDPAARLRRCARRRAGLRRRPGRRRHRARRAARCA